MPSAKSDILAAIAALRRPRLLIRAARAGLGDYDRIRDLRRLVRTRDTPGPDVALRHLLEEEVRLEATRQTGDASYCMARHVEVMIAMMAEAAAFRPSGPAPIHPAPTCPNLASPNMA